ncbi:MAG: hypothetical protein KDD94_13815, partial [Calditrichaeota bacterium]|nr:hypothetical protein [Calditrichota bacterium]
MKIELAPIDYYFYRPKLYTIQVAFEYKNKVSTQQLVDAIKKLTIKMPIIGSRLVKFSSFQIVLEVGHEIPVREQHLNKSIDFESEILFDSVSNVEGEPLIKFLVTHMKDRSYVGVSFSHILGDGAAFFMFMENFVRIISAKHLSPVLTDRSKLIAFTKGDSTVSLFESTGYIQPRPENPTHDIVEHIHYSNGHLNELKEKLRAKGCEASTNNIIMADLAKRFYKDIPNFKNQFIIRCPVDYRKAIGLGTNYFGNAVRDAV